MNKSIDIEVPLDITANDLVIAWNNAYNLEIKTDNLMDVYLKAENPIAFLKGNATLSEYKIRDGSIINII